MVSIIECQFQKLFGFKGYDLRPHCNSTYPSYPTVNGPKLTFSLGQVMEKSNLERLRLQVLGDWGSAVVITQMCF